MPAVGFSHYNLRAPRALLDKLYAFYTEVVGLAPGYRPPFARPGYWLYTGRDAVLHLTEAGADEARTADARSTFDHVAFVCKDRAAFERSLLDHGIAFRTTSVPGARTVQLFLRDPAGNGVELNFDDPADTSLAP